MKTPTSSNTLLEIRFFTSEGSPTSGESKIIFLTKSGSSFATETSFTSDFQILCALITHLGTHERWQSRTPSEIAGSLAMRPDEVERVLCSYPCFFRESENRKNGERLFTVHLRYARRKKDPDTGSNVSEPMNPEEVGMLINILMQMVSIERQDSRFTKELQESNKRHFLTTLVAIIVALLSTTTTLIVAIHK